MGESMLGQATREPVPPVGRGSECALIAAEVAAAEAGALRVLSFEGEAGIGKTRLLEVAAEAARARGCVAALSGADEDLQAPFLLMRTLLGSPALDRIADKPPVHEALQRAIRVLAGGDGVVGGQKPGDERVQVFDQVALALRALASRRPLALLLDDLDWSDEASLQMLRYCIRVVWTSPILFVLALRSEDAPITGAAQRLVADLERAHLARRNRLARTVLTAGVSRAHRRAVHAAIVDLLESGDQPRAVRLPALAHHALRAGQTERGIRYAAAAARASLASGAPKEALRIVDEASAVSYAPGDRVELLHLRDDALAVLGRDDPVCVSRRATWERAPTAPRRALLQGRWKLDRSAARTPSLGGSGIRGARSRAPRAGRGGRGSEMCKTQIRFESTQTFCGLRVALCLPRRQSPALAS